MIANLLGTFGDLSLPLFLALVGILLLATALPAGTRRGRWWRLLVVYVGNLGVDDDGGEPERRSARPDLRQLVGSIAGAFEEHRVPLESRDPFLEDLRNAIQSERELLAQRELDERERRFLAARRWELAQRLELLIDDVSPEIVAGIKTASFAADAE
jgi:hypothetical protein